MTHSEEDVGTLGGNMKDQDDVEAERLLSTGGN